MNLRHHQRDERGAIAVMTALLALALLVSCAFVLDFGQAYANKRQDQTAVDAAALAAGTVYQNQTKWVASATGNKTCDVLKTSDITTWSTLASKAQDQAESLLDENLSGATITDFAVTCKKKPDGTNSKEFLIDVTADKDSPIGLGQLVTDSESITVSREAQATVVITETAIPGTPAIPGSPAIPGDLVGGCSMCFLGSSMETGNADYTVTGGGDIYFNGDVTTGNHMGHVKANKITIVGTPDGNFDPAPTHSSTPFADPYASMTPLASTGLTAKTNPCGPGSTHGPGIYGPFTLPNSACPLQPGAYYITGKWRAQGAQTNLSGTGVTLYFASPNGELDMRPGKISNLVAPTSSPLLTANWPMGFAIIYEHTNTHNVGLQGTGGTSITGGVYAPKSALDFNGTADFGFNLGPVVVDSATGNGNHGNVFLTNAHNVGGVPGPGTPAVPDTPGTEGQDGVDGSMSLTK
jgi:hypothetical protein